MRIALIDLMRGVALIAMTIFHLGWDLGMFAVIDMRVMFEPGPRWFARCIAGTFLFLVGFSLWLAHRDGISWRPWLIRLAQVGGAAAVITIATWFATPDAFIFFGILHSIALASVLGLAFLRLPWWATAVAAIFVLVSRPFLQTPHARWAGVVVDGAFGDHSGVERLCSRLSLFRDGPHGHCGGPACRFARLAVDTGRAEARPARRAVTALHWQAQPCLLPASPAGDDRDSLCSTQGCRAYLTNGVNVASLS